MHGKEVGFGVEETLEFGEGDHGASECDTTSVAAEEDGEFLGEGLRVVIKVIEFRDVIAEGGEDCSKTDEAVEAGDELGQVGDSDSLCDRAADCASKEHHCCPLGEEGKWVVHHAECCHNAEADTKSAK